MIKPLLIATLLLVHSDVDGGELVVNKELRCLTANLFFEARGETVKGMMGVASVTMNRVKSERFPKTVCNVVHQRKQFSWTHLVNKSKQLKILSGNVGDLRKSDSEAYYNALMVSERALRGDYDKLQGSMFYHADYVKPAWSKKMKRVKKIDKHIFYKG